MDWIWYLIDKFVLLLVLLLAAKIALGFLTLWVMRMMEEWKGAKDGMVPNISISQGLGLVLKEIAPAIGSAAKIKLEQWAKGKKG